MKIRGESGSMPARMGGRASAVRGGKSAKKDVKVALKTAKKSKPLAEPKSAVKVLPRKTAPKSGLEGRGTKLSPAKQKERAQQLRFDKQERNYERSMENQYQGSYTGKDNKFFSGKPGKANVKKTEAIKKAAGKRLPVKVNSATRNGRKRSTVEDW